MRHRSQRPVCAGGFTLVELVAVMAVVGVVAVVVLPRATSSTAYRRADGAAREAAAVLTRAAADAVASGERRLVIFEPTSNRYRHGRVVGNLLIESIDLADGPFDATMTAALFANVGGPGTGATVVFDAWGRPRLATPGPASPVAPAAEGFVRFASGPHERSVTVNASGLVTIGGGP